MAHFHNPPKIVLSQNLELLTARLQDANYPIREIEVIERDEETIEVVASLLGTSANREELDAVITALDRAEITRHASWAARTLERIKMRAMPPVCRCSDAYGARAAGARRRSHL